MIKEYIVYHWAFGDWFFMSLIIVIYLSQRENFPPRAPYPDLMKISKDESQ